MRLQEKTALATGTTSGIGAAIAQAFARDATQAIAQTIRQAGGEAHVVIADMTSNQGIDHLVRKRSDELKVYCKTLSIHASRRVQFLLAPHTGNNRESYL